MVVVDLKASIVALVFAAVFGAAGYGIRSIVRCYCMDIEEPLWVRALWVLVPAGLIGGWMLGWGLAGGVSG